MPALPSSLISSLSTAPAAAFVPESVAGLPAVLAELPDPPGRRGVTNEITRFGPLLDQFGDLQDTVVTADALHCQRDHIAYLTTRGAHWILTVKGNQPSLHAQLAAMPWRAVPDADRDTDRGHGRREIRTLKIVSSPPDRFPERRPSHADPPPQTPPR